MVMNMGQARKKVRIVERNSGAVLIETARWCRSYFCRLVGYQFRRRLKPGEALILVYRNESIRNSSIHMFFVLTPLTVVWINRAGRITSVQLAQPWRPYYASPEPACYVLETSPEAIDKFHPGDELDFVML